MDCRGVLDHLCGYLDGELAPGLGLEVASHLPQCPGCGALVEGCRQTIRAYRQQAAPALPAELHQKIMAGLPGLRPPLAR